MRLGKIVVNLGFNCNFKCAHCANGEQKKRRLSPAEIGTVISTINNYRIKKIHFIGGEPTLYLKNIQKLIAGIEYVRGLKVTITTNGSFAKTKEVANRVLSRIPYLSAVQLSYDKFHARFLPASYVGNVFAASINLGVRFSVQCAMQCPEDMLIVSPLRRLGRFPIYLQKVLPQGRAIRTGVSYSPYKEFDKKVLTRYCPDRNNLIYICGKGFTVCCSALAINHDFKGVCHETAENLFKSGFYQMVKRYSMGELMSKFGINSDGIRPEHSSLCNVCEYVFLNRKAGVVEWN